MRNVEVNKMLAALKARIEKLEKHLFSQKDDKPQVAKEAPKPTIKK
jgi:hypothetical protein